MKIGQTIYPDAPAYIYIVRVFGDYYKIGWSMSPKQRAGGLGLSVNDIVHVIATRVPVWAESFIHDSLEHCFVHPGDLPEGVTHKIRGGRCEIYKLGEKEIANLKGIEELQIRDTLEYYMASFKEDSKWAQ